MKWYDDWESPRKQNKRGKHRKASYVPGKSRSSIAEDITFADLWQQFILTIRRKKAALRFKLQVLLKTIFNKKNLLKASALLVLAYISFGYKGKTEVITRSEVVRPVHFEESVSEGNQELPSIAEQPTEKKPEKNREKKFAPPKTDLAPISADDISDPKVRAYVKRFYEVAQTEMDKYGIPASINLAQGLIESRAGTSKLARANNNHFGIKCFSKRCGKGHCSNHFDDHHKDFFRIYKSAWESWRAHSKMISSGRYSSLKKHGTDYKKWARGLQQKGYATDKRYADKLIDMIQRYKLYRYDQK